MFVSVPIMEVVRLEEKENVYMHQGIFVVEGEYYFVDDSEISDSSAENVVIERSNAIRIKDGQYGELLLYREVSMSKDKDKSHKISDVEFKELEIDDYGGYLFEIFLRYLEHDSGFKIKSSKSFLSVVDNYLEVDYIDSSEHIDERVYISLGYGFELEFIISIIDDYLFLTDGQLLVNDLFICDIDDIPLGEVYIEEGSIEDHLFYNDYSDYVAEGIGVLLLGEDMAGRTLEDYFLL